MIYKTLAKLLIAMVLVIGMVVGMTKAVSYTTDKATLKGSLFLAKEQIIKPPVSYPPLSPIPTIIPSPITPTPTLPPSQWPVTVQKIKSNGLVEFSYKKDLQNPIWGKTLDLGAYSFTDSNNYSYEFYVRSNLTDVQCGVCNPATNFYTISIDNFSGVSAKLLNISVTATNYVGGIMNLYNGSLNKFTVSNVNVFALPYAFDNRDVKITIVFQSKGTVAVGVDPMVNYNLKIKPSMNNNFLPPTGETL